MKTIDTLVDDILSLVDKGGEVSAELVGEFSTGLAKIVANRLAEKRGPAYLRVSNLGTQCDRKLWLQIRFPEVVEPLSPETKLKFLIGDIHEAVLLFLAAASGHKVTDQQKEIDVDGVKGHLDAKIDDVTVDVKSASSAAFKKFETGLTPEQDNFGYLVQLGTYVDIEGETEGAFLATDKTLGKITLDRHSEDLHTDSHALVRQKREMLESERMPRRAFEDIPDGKSGNRKLGTYCSYCDVKEACWPGLRTYAYSNGPRFLTKVVREPKVDGERYDPIASPDDPF